MPPSPKRRCMGLDTQARAPIHLPATAGPNKFGDLGIFPAEIRFNIWSHLGPHTAMMCANRIIGTELKSFVYDRLSITIQPFDNDTNPQDNPFPTALTNYGGILPNHWLSCIDLLQKIRTFEFIVQAPLSADPGELLRCHTAHTHMVGEITRLVRCPEIRVRVVESKSREWYKGTTWNRKWSTNFSEGNSPILKSAHCGRSAQPTDLEIALFPFLIDNSYGNIIVRLPPNMYRDGFDPSDRFCGAGDLRIGAPSTPTDHTIFGIENIGSGPPWKRRANPRAYLLERTLHLSLLNLPGRTAALLRLNLFSNWNPEFERRIYDVLDGVWQPWTGPTAATGFTRELEDFEALYREMRAWNPWSLKHFDDSTATEIANDTDEESRIRAAMSAHPPHGFRADGWCAATWAKRYPEGIPPRGSWEYQDQEVMYGDWGMVGMVILEEEGIQHEYDDHLLFERWGGWHGEGFLRSDD